MALTGAAAAERDATGIDVLRGIRTVSQPALKTRFPKEPKHIYANLSAMDEIGITVCEEIV